MTNMTSLQSPELATSCSDASKKPPHYDDVVVGTKFLKTVRGDKLHCRYWRRKSGTEEDEGDLKGLLFLCHGYGEHLDWYGELAAHLASEKHLLVFGHDHIGHGLSDGERAIVGDLDEIYVNDVFLHVFTVRAEFRGLPCFLYGHSMGGLVAVRAGRRNPSLFSGMVLEAPLAKFHADVTSAEYVIAKLAGWLVPTARSFRRVPERNVTSDPEMQKKIAEDPLWYKGGLKLNMGTLLVECVKDYITVDELAKLTMPLLIMHGDLDAVSHPHGSKEIHRKAKADDKQLITFDNGRHHLLLERPDIRKQVIAETAEWISQRI